jgi:hypothetical protein
MFKRLCAFGLATVFISCGSTSDFSTSSASYPGGTLSCASSDPSGQVTPSYSAASNVVGLSVNGAHCCSGSNCATATTANSSGANGIPQSEQYINEPCVSVTVCQPGSTTNCVTLNGILLDTGSFGLRVFSQALGSVNSQLTQFTNNSNPVGECATFGTGADWGPIKKADVTVGGETASNISIQVIDTTFATVPSTCNGGVVDTSPDQAHFNGILGVGLFSTDCGAYCDPEYTGGTADNKVYFACSGSSSGSSCSSIAMPVTVNPLTTDQVTNPVANFSTDNNGVAVALPPVTDSGVSSLEGYLIFGIGTELNNVAPLSVASFNTNNETSEMSSTLPGSPPQNYSSFIDSGSNGIFFPKIYSNVPTCANSPDFYCPSCNVNVAATNIGSLSGQTGAATFQVGNFQSLYFTGNKAFTNTTGSANSLVDLGLPFFYGRTVYVGIEPYQTGSSATTPLPSSSLGVGPLWGY